MTDELIKQNAVKYSEQHCSGYVDGGLVDAYITGAHSCDEEIKNLETKVSALQTAYEAETDVLENKIIELRAMINKLHNPWISVEDDLPKISDKKGSISSEPVFVKIVSSEDGKVYHGIGTYYAYSIDKPWCIRNERDSVTHWMQIP